MMKDIKGYEGHYAVSDTGKVYSIKNKKELKPSLHPTGYYVVKLYKNNIAKNYRVHRLVAEAFIPNPNGKPTVNHKSGNKIDNRVGNLEWATYLENNLHSIHVLGRSKKPVECIETHEIYNSIQEAADAKKVNRSNIYSVCVGKRITTGGYHWRYVKEKNA